MDDRFRDFRRGVAAPSEDARRRASERLARVVDGEQTARSGTLRLIAKRPRLSALALVALSGAAAAALFVSAPRNDSPGFLARAQAALARDAAVLHAKWEETTTSTEPACTVTRGPNEIWIDLTPPYRYRAFVHGFPDPANANPAAPACSGGTATELGGTFDPLQTLRFVPPNTLHDSPLLFKLPPDPVAEFREAISEGRAHDEGDAELGGRTVRRIRVDPPPCPDRHCRREPGYVYVDRETFYPVEIRGPAGSDAGNPVHIVTQYLTYEYLPPTAANLALTDIQAQHPNATVNG
jgi:hypothetical protein